MGQAERDEINKILINLPDNRRLFRSNSGMGWTGKSTKKGDFLIIKNPRPLHAMPEGWPDLTGWTEIEITPDMVGKKIAVFTAVEVKTGRLKLTDKQKSFRKIIEKMGGIFITHKTESIQP